MNRIPTPAADTALSTPTSFDRLCVGELVGEGAQSIVHRVTLDGEAYALKRYVGPMNAADALRLYRREAAIHAGLSHPAIPRILEVGLAGSTPYLLTELVEGDELGEVLGRRYLQPGEVIQLARLLADVLEVVHTQGVVHRDIKPANIIVATSGDYRLIDFGLAGQDTEEAEDRAVGTFRYCSPEQLGLLERPIDGRSDLYAVGIVLYHCASGVAPFDADNIAELFHQHTAVVPPRLDVVVPGFDPVFASIVERLLAKEPDERYQSAASLAQDLKDLSRLRAVHRRGERVALGRRMSLVTQPRVFVGREPELELLSAAWAASQEGSGGAVLIKGGAGSGKTGLVETFIGRCVRGGAPVLRAKCTEGDPFPLAPLRAAFGSYVDGFGRPLGGARCQEEKQLVEAAGNMGRLLAPLHPALGRVLGVDGGMMAHTDGRDLYYNALATFTLALGDVHGGIVLWIDDVQWLDEASAEALLRVAAQLSGHKVLMVFTARNGDAHRGALEAFRDSFDPYGLKVARLKGLDRSGMKELIRQGLGGGLPEAFVDRLISRSQGSPLALWQFFGALKEGGALLPHWGLWRIDSEVLATLDLPSDLYSLMVQRLTYLSEGARRVLSVAALLGHHIDHHLLTLVCGEGFRVVQGALSEAQQSQLIEPNADSDGFSFVHDRVREALLRLIDRDVGEFHRRASDVLSVVSDPSPRQIFERASHTILGYRGLDAARVFDACLEAGELALSEHAYVTAGELLGEAHKQGVAPNRDVATRLRLHRALGEACFQTSLVPEALAHFGEALTCTDEDLERAKVRAAMARVMVYTLDTSDSAKELERAFGELGITLPTVEYQEPGALQAAVMALMKEGMAATSDPGRFGCAQGALRERHKAAIDLAELGFLVGYYDRNPLFSMQCGVLGLIPAHELGATPEACRGLGTFTFLMGLLGKPDAVERFSAIAISHARALGDRAGLAATINTCAIGKHLAGRGDEALELQQEVLRGYGQWIGPIAFQNTCVDLSFNHFSRGQFRDDLEVSLAAVARMETSEGVIAGGYACRAYAAAMSAAAGLGLIEDAGRYLKKVESFVGKVPADQAVPWISVAGFKVNYYLQQREFGAEFEAAVDAHQAWGIPPERSAHHSKQFYIAHAYARLELALAAAPEEKGRRLADLRAAMDELSATAKTDLLRAHEQVITASLALFSGDLEACEACLDQARRMATREDNPWVLFEEARARARMLHARQKRHWAYLEVSRALSIADEYGWVMQKRWLNEEFKAVEQTRTMVGHQSGAASRTAARSGADLRLKRQLDALLSLSRVSASILDPAQLAQVALDESARVLGAERAYLFVVDDETSELIFERGRSSDHQDLPEPLEYSQTIVQQVRSSGQAVVLSTGKSTTRLTTESVMAYGLRSVLAAPLLSGDRVIGVLYLDNRLVKGIFDQDHVDILTALGHHITTAIETVRAARLEVSLQAETQRRHLADMLRELNTRLTSTLDLMDTIELLSNALAAELPSAGSVAAVYEEDGPRPVLVRGLGDDRLPGELERHLKALCVNQVSEGAANALVGDDGTERWCLSLPLSARETRVGCLLLVRPAELPFSQGDVDMGVALVSQAAIAIDNARLFRKIRTLAEKDELTGLFNRREFFRRANGLVEIAGRRKVPLSAIMFDVDHFKRFNDTYGHAIGDDVLALVSQSAQRAIRGRDVLCRYGGEEFAILLPGATVRVAAIVAERVRVTIETSPLDTEAHGPLSVTVSVGVSAFKEGDDLKRLLSRADMGLYQSKEAGRNTVSINLSEPAPEDAESAA